MANRIFQKPQLNLSRRGQQPFFVDMEAFFDFSFSLAEDLNDFIATYELQNPSSRSRKLLASVEAHKVLGTKKPS